MGGYIPLTLPSCKQACQLLHGRAVMGKLAEALEGHGEGGWPGVEYVFIDGETDSQDRRRACQRFRDDPSIRAALLSVTAAGADLTLPMTFLHAQTLPRLGSSRLMSPSCWPVLKDDRRACSNAGLAFLRHSHAGSLRNN
jgi:hypothetical protein